MELKHCQWGGNVFTATFEIGNGDKKYTVAEVSAMVEQIHQKCHRLKGYPMVDVRRQGNICTIRLGYDQVNVWKYFKQTEAQELGTLIEKDVRELLPMY